MFLNNNKIKLFGVYLMSIQVLLLIVGASHFLPENECCHPKPEKKHPCCQMDDNIAVVETCPMNSSEKSLTSCGCIHNGANNIIDFKIEQINTIDKIQYVTSFADNIISDQGITTKIFQCKKYQIPPLRLFIQNSSFLI